MMPVAESLSFLDVLSGYTRTMILFCILAQIIAMCLGYFFRIPALNRMAISVTSAVTGFAAGVYMTDSNALWVMLFFGMFFSTYYFMPPLVGEAKNARTVDGGQV